MFEYDFKINAWKSQLNCLSFLKHYEYPWNHFQFSIWVYLEWVSTYRLAFISTGFVTASCLAATLFLSLTFPPSSLLQATFAYYLPSSPSEITNQLTISVKNSWTESPEVPVAFNLIHYQGFWLIHFVWS